jgi:hypothetical protein
MPKKRGVGKDDVSAADGMVNSSKNDVVNKSVASNANKSTRQKKPMKKI